MKYHIIYQIVIRLPVDIFISLRVPEMGIVKQFINNYQMVYIYLEFIKHN